MQDGVLRVPAVCEITGLSYTTIWRLECDGMFPSRVRIGLRAVGWLRSDIDAWLENLKSPDEQN